MLEVNLNKENFENEVKNSDKLVIVDFWATWCGPCQMLAPVLEKIAEEKKNTVKVCKVNVDEEQELALEYGIMNIPTLIMFKNGEVKNTSVGFHSKSELEDMINNI